MTYRLWHTLRLWMILDGEKRAAYIKKCNLFHHIGDACTIIEKNSAEQQETESKETWDAVSYTHLDVYKRQAYACNKVGCVVGSFTSSIRFLKNGLIDMKTALFVGAVTFACSTCGAQIVLHLPERPLKIMILASMPAVAALIFFQKNYPEINRTSEITGWKRTGLCLLSGIMMGLYDGILGPGSGTVVMILFTKLLKYDLITASGNTKVILLASTLAASVSYILAGKVIWTVAIPVSVFGMLGGYVGAGMAIKKGTKFIRPMMLGIAALLVIKMAVDLVHGGV